MATAFYFIFAAAKRALAREGLTSSKIGWIYQPGAWKCELGESICQFGAWTCQLCAFKCQMSVRTCLSVTVFSAESEDFRFLWMLAASVARHCKQSDLKVVIKSAASTAQTLPPQIQQLPKDVHEECNEIVEHHDKEGPITS